MCTLKINSFRVFRACITTTFIYLALVYIDSYTSPIEDELLEKRIFTENVYPFFVSTTFLGAMLSSFVVGPISEWLGCKTVLIAFSPFTFIGGFLLVLGNDSASMTIAKGLIGLYSGLALSCGAVYNAEISPPNLRKFYGSLLGVAVRFSVFLSYFLGIWLNFRWLALVFMIIMSFVVLNLLFLPESPKWLIKHGYMEKAKQANEYYYNYDTYLESLPGVEYIYHDLPIKQKLSSYFVWPVIRPLLICCSIHILKTSSGYELLLAYSSHTLEKGVSMDPNVVSLFYGIFLCCGSILFVCICHRVNWKILIMITTFVQCLCNGLLGLAFHLSLNIFKCSDNTRETIICDILQYSPILLLSCYAFAMALGWGSLSYWLLGEILHHHYTRVSAGIVLFVSYTSGYLNEIIAPLLVDYVGAAPVFVGYAVVCLIGLFIEYLY